MRLTRELTLRGHDQQEIHTWIGENQNLFVRQANNPEITKHEKGLEAHLNIIQKSDGHQEFPHLYMNGALQIHFPKQGWTINGELINETYKELDSKEENIHIGYYNGSVIHFDISIHPFEEEPYHLFEDFGEKESDFMFNPATQTSPYTSRFEKQHGKIVYVQFPTNKKKNFEAPFTVQTVARAVKFLSDEVNKTTTKGLGALCEQATINHSQDVFWYRQEIQHVKQKIQQQNKAYNSLVENNILKR
ncbi:MAG: hypothetical protein ACMXYD_04265 [Candidatus Woesearchaeota archaeon]